MCLLNILTLRWESCQCFVNTRFYFLRVLLNSWAVLKQDLGGETHGFNQGWRRGRLKWSCILLLCRVMSPELWVLSLAVWVDWREVTCWVSGREAVGWCCWVGGNFSLVNGYSNCALLVWLSVWPSLYLLRCAQRLWITGILFWLLEKCFAVIRSVTLSVLTWLFSNWCSWEWAALVLT